LMVCWGVNLPVAQHMSRVDCVVVIQWWWCGLDCGGVLGVLLLVVWWCCSWLAVFLAEQISPLWCFYTGLCYLGAWHLDACIWWVCCCGLACPSRLPWDIFTRELGDKLKILMIIYSGIVILDCHLVITILGDFCLFITCLQVSRRKEERKERKKERKKTYSFLFRICNL
jgi:hypothetical protein